MRILLLLAVQLVLATPAFAQPRPDTKTCSSTAVDPDERIAACTRLTTPGEVPPEILPLVFSNRGNAWRAKGENDRAISDFSEAIRLGPQNAIGYYNRGNAWEYKGDHDRAISDYSDAIRVNPQYATAYNNRGSAWKAKGENDRAISDYSEAIRLNPEFALAYYNRGAMWHLGHDSERAISDYNEAIRLNPQVAGPYGGLALLLASSPNAKARDGRQAVELAQKACELTGWKNPIMIDALAIAYAEVGKFDDAMRWQRKAMEFPGYMNVYGDNARARIELFRARKPYRE